MGSSRWRRLLAVGLAWGLVGLAGCSEDTVDSIESDASSAPDGSSPRLGAKPEIEQIDVGNRPLQPEASTSIEVTVANPSEASLTYNWRVDHPDWTLEANASSAKLTAPARYDSRATVILVVETDQGRSVRRDVTIRTVPNQPPRITSLSAAPNPVEAGETTTLEAQVEDGNGDETSLSWSAPEGWSLDSTTGTSVELTVPDASDTSAHVTVTASDGFDGTSTRGLTLSTAPNRPPIVESMSASPPQLDPGGKATVSVEASDPNGDELAYQWTVPESWSTEGEGADVDLAAPDRVGATTSVRVVVSDGDRKTSASVVVSTAQRNQAPILQSFDAYPRTVEPGGTIDLAASATDPEGDALSYTWSVAGGGWALESTDQASTTLTAPDVSGQRTTVTLTISDDNGHQVEASRVVSTRANRAPRLNSLEARPSTIEPGGTLSVEARATDPDGDALTYDWTAPGGWSISGQGDSVQVTAPDTYAASGTIELVVEDARGQQSARGTVRVATATNRTPRVTSLTANPSVIRGGRTTSVRVDASDPDGDTLSYNWSVPNPWSIRASNGRSIDVQAPLQPNSSARLEVEVVDGHGGTVEASVVVQTSSDAFYDFNSHTFDNCRQEGRRGPTVSMCRNRYGASWVERDVYYDMSTRGIQRWTVPEDGTYRIEAAGAWSGDPSGGGAVVRGDVQLEAGETLSILVGQKGASPSSRGTGGGGGTFVARGSDLQKADLLLVAGGGSRGIHGAPETPGRDAFVQFPLLPTVRKANESPGGDNGQGGGASRFGAGGGGAYAKGDDGNTSASGGQPFRNGGLGGTTIGPSSICPGGFGGGGGCKPGQTSKARKGHGGAGGYSGGGGTHLPRKSSNIVVRGGSGGSFVARECSNVATSDGSFRDQSSRDDGYGGSVSELDQYNDDHGYVRITRQTP